MTILDIDSLRTRRADIQRIAEQNGITNIRVFGSVARGQAGPESDLDLLVEIRPGRSLFDLVGFEQDLSDVLGLNVQVFTEGSLHRVFKDCILMGAVAV